MAMDVEVGREAAADALERDLEDILAALASQTAGEVADYIPELSKARPDWFGICLATADGAVYEVGDARQEFTIQSISKPFSYALALSDRGEDEVLRRVGVEPTGDAFNSIEIDESSRRPFNPMVNAGAIVTTGMVRGGEPAERLDRLVTWMSGFAGRPLSVDDAVFRSERETGDRNRAIAYFMRAHGMLADVDAALDLYFRQCAVLVTCRDLAVMAATLANGGVNPVTGERAMDAEHVDRVLSVMATCGMYDFAGEWLFTVGLPAKSGVTGGIIAVLPGQMGIGVFSPPLDARGNSVRGVAACQELSRRYQLHEYRPGLVSTNPVRRRYFADTARARRTRTPEEEAVLDREGRRTVVYELRGMLSFATAERLLRTVEADIGSIDNAILDFHRVTGIDGSAAGLLDRLGDRADRAGVRLIVAHATGRVAGALEATDLDDALAVVEDAALVAELGARATVVPLPDQPLLAGVSGDARAAVEESAVLVALAPGDVLCHEGDPADGIYLVCSGALRAMARGSGNGAGTPLMTLGPGATIGEIALLDGGPRSATVIAVDAAVVRFLSFRSLEDLAGRFPALMGTLYRNLGSLLAMRVRRLTAHVRALEE